MPWTNTAPNAATNTAQLKAARSHTQAAMLRVDAARDALEKVEQRERARGKHSAALSDLAIRYLPQLRKAYDELDRSAQKIAGVLSRPEGWEESQEEADLAGGSRTWFSWEGSGRASTRSPEAKDRLLKSFYGIPVEDESEGGTVGEPDQPQRVRYTR